MLPVRRESNAGASLVFAVRVDAAPAGPVTVALACGASCQGRVRLDPALAALPRGEWTTVGVPLACFAKAGADLAKVDGVLAVESATALDFSVSRVAVENVSAHRVDCPNP